MNGYDPGQYDGKTPFRALDGSLDVYRRAGILCIDSKLKVLEVRRVVYHVEKESEKRC